MLIVDENGQSIPAGKVGIYRTYGGVATARLTGAITGSGNLRRTDGGTLYIDSDGSAFTGTLTNARGNLYLVSTVDTTDRPGRSRWSGSCLWSRIILTGMRCTTLT